VLCSVRLDFYVEKECCDLKRRHPQINKNFFSLDSYFQDFLGAFIKFFFLVPELIINDFWGYNTFFYDESRALFQIYC